MYTEDDLLMLSGLQHFRFCPRQWGLIHLEDGWAENRLTAEGRVLHQRVDRTETEVRGDVRIARGLAIQSLRLGLAGRADAVEFHRAGEGEPGVALPRVRGRWRPFPVEYKRGRPKRDPCDLVQLCAQALCLEEMLGIDIPAGALYYGQTRRRLDVPFDAPLRAETEALAAAMHDAFHRGVTPPPSPGKHCDSCSLKDQCLPRHTAGDRAADYLEKAIRDALEEDPP